MKAEASPLLTSDTAPSSYLFIRSRQTAVLVTLALLFLAVMSKEGSNTALPATLPAVQSYMAVSGSLLSMPGFHSGMYAVGKISQIYITYTLGGRTTLFLVLLLSSVGQLLFTTGELPLMYGGIGLSAFANAHVWGASTRLLSFWVDHDQMGRAVGWTLAAANDMSWVVFTALFSALQAASADEDAHWHAFNAFYVMALMLLLSATLTLAFIRSSATAAGFAPPRLIQVKERSGDEEGAVGSVGESAVTARPLVAGEHPLDSVQLLPALWAMLSSGRYWAIFIPYLVSMLGQGSIYQFVTIVAVEDLGFTDSAASLILTAFSCGALAADFLSGYSKDMLSAATVHHITIAATIILVAAGSSLVVLSSTGSRDELARLLPYLVLVIAIPASWFHVLVMTFQIRFAGPTHAASIAGITDVIVNLVGLPYNLGLGILVGRGYFTAYWAIASTLSSVAIICGTIALRIDALSPVLARPT